ncbi:MAG: transketolase [Anaerolineales bacterium]
MTKNDITTQTINTIRFLSADAVQKANSGHPGLPMGAAAMAYALWQRHLRFNPNDPAWVNRDRFVLSAGHGSMLLYTLLHLYGYDLSLEQIKNFRQFESKTPGHPEYGLTPGVETTTGPLGQGFANGVGMAIAAEHQAARFNRKGFDLFDHHIFAIVSDGDLMEGVSAEAASLAGHLRLGRIVYLYDDNHISIDGSTELTFTDDTAQRFSAYGWNVIKIKDGNDVDAVDEAITQAKADPRPSLIVCPTHIGFGLPTKQDTAAAHGEPPGAEELAGAKKKLGWPEEPPFLVPEEVVEHCREASRRGMQAYESWQKVFAGYENEHPVQAKSLERSLAKELPDTLVGSIPVFATDAKGLATRASSGKVLNAVASVLPEMIGGSADLTGSNKTKLEGDTAFSADDRAGRYLHFGVREHCMGAVLNGLAVYGGLIPFGGTFLVFSDYMRPTIRLAAMMEQRVIYVFSHDSIGLGEDGPTHQPVEHLAALRSIPNLAVIRPGDANETAAAWLMALERVHGPTALILTRQAVPTLDRERFAPAQGLRKGAYVLADLGERDPQLILMASGSEVALILEAAEMLAAEGISVRVVSFPCWKLFAEQPQSYRAEVLPDHLTARIAVEAAIEQGWERWLGSEGRFIGMESFGASAPYKQLYQHFGITVEQVVEAARQLVK